MIVKEEFLSKLRRYFSLNLYEVKIWTALLSRGVSTAGELSDIANVPRSRSYDVLESLEKKGFVIMKIGKPIKYIAVPPNEVIDRVKKRIKEESDKQEKSMEELKGSNVLQELTTLHTQGIDLVEPTELSGSVKGIDNIHNHIELLLKDAEEEVIIMTTTKGFVKKIEALKKQLKKAVDRGVKIKIAVPLTKECKETVASLKGIAEVRHVSDLKARFVIADAEQLFFMLLDTEEAHPSYDVGIWVNTPFFASALESLFNQAWKGMEKTPAALK